jgi:hypothetical protein
MDYELRMLDAEFEMLNPEMQQLLTINHELIDNANEHS